MLQQRQLDSQLFTDDSNNVLHHFRHWNPFCWRECIKKAATSTLLEFQYSLQQRNEVIPSKSKKLKK